MAQFDGTCVYEHRDPRKGSHPHWGTLIYNYGRPGVSNFLIANALFWADRYHADGIGWMRWRPCCIWITVKPGRMGC